MRHFQRALIGLSMVLGLAAMPRPADAATYVFLTHGSKASSSAMTDMYNYLTARNSSVIYLKLGIYNDGGSSMTSGSAHNISWHGPSGACNGVTTQTNYLTDAKKVCPWRGIDGTGRCQGHDNWDSVNKRYNHNRNQETMHVGMHIAWAAYDHVGLYGQTLKLVGHSAGGQWNVAAVKYRGTTNFPAATGVPVTEYVSLGSPHEGVCAACNDSAGELLDLNTDGGFIKESLYKFMPSGVDHTRIASSYNDGPVSDWMGGNDYAASVLSVFAGEVEVRSAAWGYMMNFGHTVAYATNAFVPVYTHHEEYTYTAKGTQYCGGTTSSSCNARYKDNGGSWYDSTSYGGGGSLYNTYMALNSTAW